MSVEFEMVLTDDDALKIRNMLGPKPERCIIADCIYKSGSFCGFSFSVSDTKGQYLSVPYSQMPVSGYADLSGRLAARKKDPLRKDAADVLEAIVVIVRELGLDLKDEEVEGLVDLTHPVLLANAVKR